MSEPRTERRKHPRRPVLLDCRLEGEPHAAMRLTDLSAGGCFVQTQAVLPEGSRVALHATLSGIEVPLVGRVIRVQPGRGFGFAIDFSDLSQEARQRLAEFLELEPFP